mgnify:FL=1
MWTLVDLYMHETEQKDLMCVTRELLQTETDVFETSKQDRKAQNRNMKETNKKFKERSMEISAVCRFLSNISNRGLMSVTKCERLVRDDIQGIECVQLQYQGLDACHKV